MLVQDDAYKSVLNGPKLQVLVHPFHTLGALMGAVSIPSRGVMETLTARMAVMKWLVEVSGIHIILPCTTNQNGSSPNPVLKIGNFKLVVFLWNLACLVSLNVIVHTHFRYIRTLGNTSTHFLNSEISLPDSIMAR